MRAEEIRWCHCGSRAVDYDHLTEVALCAECKYRIHPSCALCTGEINQEDADATWRLIRRIVGNDEPSTLQERWAIDNGKRLWEESQQGIDEPTRLKMQQSWEEGYLAALWDFEDNSVKEENPYDKPGDGNDHRFR